MVNVSGAIRVAILTFAQEFPVNEYWIMVREDGQWKWCGVGATGSFPAPSGIPWPVSEDYWRANPRYLA